MKAALAAVALSLAAAARGDEARDGGAVRDGGSATASSAPRAHRPDGGAAAKEDADEDLVRHLDEVEKLELLENLELFDPAPEEKAR